MIFDNKTSYRQALKLILRYWIPFKSRRDGAFEKFAIKSSTWPRFSNACFERNLPDERLCDREKYKIRLARHDILKFSLLNKMRRFLNSNIFLYFYELCMMIPRMERFIINLKLYAPILCQRLPIKGDKQ